MAKKLSFSIPTTNIRDRQYTLASLRQRLAALSLKARRQETCPDPELAFLLKGIRLNRTKRFRQIVNWFENQEKAARQDITDQERVSADASSFVDKENLNPVAEATTTTPGQRQLPVLQKEQITPDLIIFKLPRPADFRFTPGQHVKLRLGDAQRSYSLVSAPHEPFLEFFVELVPGGDMSDRLRHIAVDDTVVLGEQAKGNFTLESQVPYHLMVATVTGINPFVSMMRTFLPQENSDQRFFLLQGASFQDEFGYRTELENLATANPQALIYIPTISRPDDPRNAGWSGEQGRVHTLIDKHREKFALTPETTAVYACGNPAMVDEVEARFRTQGFTVKVERYD